MEQTKASEVELSFQIKKEIPAERKPLYADVRGNGLAFSAVMRNTAGDLSKRYPQQSIWVTIRGLFRVYPNMDVGSRIAIIKRTEELLTGKFASIPMSSVVDTLGRSFSAAGL